MPDEQPLYAGIMYPNDLRKNILHSSKTLISSLKQYEKFIELRDKKLAYMNELRKVLKDIYMMSGRLKQVMPKTGLKPKVSQEREAKARLRAKPLTTEEKLIKEKTRLAELEDELAKVEEKLQHLE